MNNSEISKLFVIATVILGVTAACGGFNDDRTGDGFGGFEGDDGTDGNDGNDGNDDDGSGSVVTRCLGPSCPLGECGFGSACDAYDGFDPEDSSRMCSAATGAQEFCLEYERPLDNGNVELVSTVVSCGSSPTVLRRTCSAGCGYNYAPDDCAVCGEDDGCTFE